MYIETGRICHSQQGSSPRPPLRCDTCPVRPIAICASLAASPLAAFAASGRNETLHRGETIMWEGQEAPVVATVRSGLVKLTASLDDGREQIVGLAFPGDVIGQPFGARARYCATSLTQTSLCVVRRTAFEHFIRDNPPLLLALLERTLAELDRARSRMLLLGRKSIRERVASLLLELEKRSPTAPGEMLELVLNRQQMADVLGTTIETVSRQLSALRASAVIELPSQRQLRIANRPVLETLSGGA